MIRRPPRSTLDRSSAASDVYKRQHLRHRAAVAVIDDVGRRQGTDPGVELLFGQLGGELLATPLPQVWAHCGQVLLRSGRIVGSAGRPDGVIHRSLRPVNRLCKPRPVVQVFDRKGGFCSNSGFPQRAGALTVALTVLQLFGYLASLSLIHISEPTRPY